MAEQLSVYYPSVPVEMIDDILLHTRGNVEASLKLLDQLEQTMAGVVPAQTPVAPKAPAPPDAAGGDPPPAAAAPETCAKEPTICISREPSTAIGREPSTAVGRETSAPASAKRTGVRDRGGSTSSAERRGSRNGTPGASGIGRAQTEVKSKSTLGSKSSAGSSTVPSNGRTASNLSSTTKSRSTLRPTGTGPPRSGYKTSNSPKPRPADSAGGRGSVGSSSAPSPGSVLRKEVEQPPVLQLESHPLPKSALKKKGDREESFGNNSIESTSFENTRREVSFMLREQSFNESINLSESLEGSDLSSPEDKPKPKPAEEPQSKEPEEPSSFLSGACLFYQNVIKVVKRLAERQSSPDLLRMQSSLRDLRKANSGVSNQGSEGPTRTSTIILDDDSTVTLPREQTFAGLPVREDSINHGKRMLTIRLSGLGLKKAEIEDDGNCLFRAVAYQVYDDQSQYAKVRQRCCAYLEQNRELFSFCFGSETAFEEYCDRMACDKTWGDELALKAITDTYDIVTYVFVSTPGNWYLKYIPSKYNFPEETCKLNSIFLSYLSPIHYNALVYNDGSSVKLTCEEAKTLPEINSDYKTS